MREPIEYRSEISKFKAEGSVPTTITKLTKQNQASNRSHSSLAVVSVSQEIIDRGKEILL